MTILGLDIAQSTGWSIIDGKGNLLDYGIIKISLKGQAELDRLELKRFRSEYIALIVKYNPTLVVLESIFVGPDPTKAATLNQQRGIVIEATDTEVLGEYLSRVRKVILGAGKKHDKKEVFHWAVSKFSLPDFKWTKHNDITDSILLSFYGYLYKK